MAACGGCGATMSPAEAYCAGCGASVRRGPMLELELERLDAARVRPAASAPTVTAPRTVVSMGSWPASPWRWPLFLAVVGVVGAILATLTVIGGDDRARPPASSVPVPAAAATSAVPAATATVPAEPSVPITGVDTLAPTTGVGGRTSRGVSPVSPTFPPPGPLPYEVVAIDITGTAHVLDLTSGAVERRDLMTGPLAGESVTDVVGGPVGPVVLRSSLLQYHLVHLDDPERAPVALDEGTLAAHDDETGWSWFGGCRTPPCQRVTQVTGFGPGVTEGRTIDLPSPTTHVVATDGLLFVEAAGSIVLVDPSNGIQRIVATGSLLDARRHVLAVRSCNPDLTCPVSIIDLYGTAPTTSFHIDGDDIRLAPLGETVIGGTHVPALVPTLAAYDVADQRSIVIDPAALRFVSVPLRWSPDGRWLIGATGARNLVVIRVQDGAVFRVPFPGLDRAIVGLIVRAA